MSLTFKLPNSAPTRFAKTEALDVLGKTCFAEFPAVRVPGAVLWCNFELARQLGFDVPRTNQLTPKLHEQLLEILSLRAVAPDEDPGSNDIVTMYADKYGGEGVSPALGAGRAGFLRDGNLYVKGVGFTPLFKHNDKDDFVHSHGAVHLEDCLSEAVFAEVDHNLFTLGSSRIVAIIDQGKFVTEPSGRRRHVALAVRTGAQLRPGHLLAKRARGSFSPLEMFIGITRSTSQLITRKDSDTPDLSATMMRVIDDHACAAAESFRWRMIHGALSPSNMDMSGAMLDLPTQSTQPRTAPIFKLDYVQSAFGTEHKERGFHLADMYRRILRATDAATRERFNLKWINISNEMDRAYHEHLQLKLLGATGLKSDFARRIQMEDPDLAVRYTNVLLAMVALKNPGSACVARKVVTDISVLNVFNLLAKLPGDYFGDRDLKKQALKHLRPIYKGNRFHIAAKSRNVDSLVDEFVSIYRQLMNTTVDYYDSREEMENSITARAAFENEPLDALYCFPLYQDLNQAIAEYKTTGNAQCISDAIDTRITQSLRSVDGLLAQGNSRRLDDGGIEIEMRTIRGVSYSVRARNDSSHRRTLHVSIPVEAEGERFSSAVPGLGYLTKRQIQTLRYRFSIDRGKTFHDARARLLYDKQVGAVIDFGDLDTSTSIGRLEGYFFNVPTRRTPLFNDYVFAIPDRYDLT